MSAFASDKGIPAAILIAWETAAFDLIVSQRLVDELRQVLQRPKFRRYGTEADATAFLDRLSSATLANDPPTRRIVPRDEKDDYLMVLGQTAGADYVLSGDPHLTTLDDPAPPVITPRALYELLVHRGLAPVRPEGRRRN